MSLTADSDVTQLRMFLDKLPQEPCDVKRPEEFCSICKKVNAQVYYDCQKMRRSKGLIVDSETQEKEYNIEDLIKKVDEKIKGIPDHETKFEVVKPRNDDGITTLEMDDPDHPMIEIIKPNYKRPEEAKFEVVKEKKPVKFEKERASKEPAKAEKEAPADVKESDGDRTPPEEDVAVFELAEPVTEKPKEKVKFEIAKKKPSHGPEEAEGFWDGVKVEPVLEEGAVVDETRSKTPAKGAKDVKKATPGEVDTALEDRGEEDEPMEVTPVEAMDEDEDDDGEVVMAQVLEDDGNEDTDADDDIPIEVAVIGDEPAMAEDKPMVEFVKKPVMKKDEAGSKEGVAKTPKEETAVPEDGAEKVVKGEPAPDEAPKPKKLALKKIKHSARVDGGKVEVERAGDTEAKKKDSHKRTVAPKEDALKAPAAVEAKKDQKGPAASPTTSKASVETMTPAKKPHLKPKVKTVKRP